ncbi:hypothetical protein AAFF_G00220330, partial [Aldrovandia affinis]
GALWIPGPRESPDRGLFRCCFGEIQLSSEHPEAPGSLESPHAIGVSGSWTIEAAPSSETASPAPKQEASPPPTPLSLRRRNRGRSGHRSGGGVTENPPPSKNQLPSGRSGMGVLARSQCRTKGVQNQYSRRAPEP